MEHDNKYKYQFSQEQVIGSYHKLIELLNAASKSISEIQGINKQFDNIQGPIVKAVKEKIKETKAQLEESLKETVWDNLVIAFFGETNAGKSTIIETFRILFDKNQKNENGLIVGDGRTDFTKVYNEYQLSIDDHPFTLIDVPGIEGNEADFKDEIKKALHKAHYVFYVQGHNKKPDTATAKKIRDYLGNWVKVYSIYNIRGSVSNYDEEEERKQLITQGIIKTEKLISDTFQKNLGDLYVGNISVQALLSMSAKAQFSKTREDLIRGQQKLLKYFGSPENVLEFSQFQTLINLVNAKANNFTFEIIEANKQKMISLAKKIGNDINSEIASKSECINNLEAKLHDFIRETNSIVGQLRKDVKTKTNSEVDKIFTNFKEESFRIINLDCGAKVKKQLIKNAQQQAKNQLTLILPNVIRDAVSKAANKLEAKKKDLDGIFVKKIQLPLFQDVNFNIDFDDVVDDLDIDLDDVLSWGVKIAGPAAAGATIGSFIPGLGTIIGGITGAAVGGIFPFFLGPDKKAEAKNEIDKAIKQAKKLVNDKKDRSINMFQAKLDGRKIGLRNTANNELLNIDNIKSEMKDITSDLEEYINNLKNTEYGRI